MDIHFDAQEDINSFTTLLGETHNDDLENISLNETQCKKLNAHLRDWRVLSWWYGIASFKVATQHCAPKRLQLVL